MNIRQATINDAAGIAKVHVDSWQTTYKNIVPQKFLDNLSYEQRTQLWIKNITANNGRILVAETESGDIVGFTSGSKRPSNNIEDAGDLTSIYILASYQGQGIGKALLDQLFSYFKEVGYTRIFVEVLADNSAKLFYESQGATYLKTEKIIIGGAELDLFILQWQDLQTISN